MATPDVSEQDVRRILERDYPHGDIDALWMMIVSIDLAERWRVAAACLKNGGGSIEKLLGELANAEGWWREILSEAEYPLHTKKMFRRLTEDEERVIFARDRKQYDEWFHRS